MKDIDQLFKGIAILLIVAILSFLLNGFVISMLWEWFIVSKFGLPSLSIPEGVGIMFVVWMLHTSSFRKRTEEETQLAASWLFVKPMVILMFGWFVHLLV